MSVAEDVFLKTIEKDAFNNDLISSFLRVKVNVDLYKNELVEGSLGNDILVLFEGLKVPANIANKISNVSKDSFGVSMPYVSLLADASLSLFEEDNQNGFILTSPANVARTKAIKRWAEPEQYRKDARGVGFQSAIQYITLFAMMHTETTRVYSGLLDVNASPYVDRVSNANDWEGVWKIYNKLTFGHKLNSDVGVRIRENARMYGLADRGKFQILINKSSQPFFGLAALDTIQLGQRRSGV